MVSDTLRTRIKKVLSKTIPDSTRLRYLAALPQLQTFLTTHTEAYSVFESRYLMYEHLNAEWLYNAPIDFLEFGVFKGESIRYWAETNTHSDSRFYGFDTFTGLPETWDYFSGKLEDETFNVDGQLPMVDDARVQFVKGLFQDTLPGFLKSYQPADQLVLHNDSDLYSSTLYVLTQMDNLLVPGSIIIFDEFSGILHEFRALEDYAAAYRREFTVLAATMPEGHYYPQIAIQMK